jgi:hypothetical protein
MRSIEQLTEELMALPSLSRALLAKQRRDQIRNGSVQPIPGEEALAQVRRLLEQ